MSGGRVGVSEGCLGGVGRYLSAIFGNWKRTDVFWVLSLCSKGAITLFWHSLERHDFFHLTIVRPQNIKMSLYEVDKND